MLPFFAGAAMTGIVRAAASGRAVPSADGVAVWVVRYQMAMPAATSATNAPIHSQRGVRLAGGRFGRSCGPAVGWEMGILSGVIAFSKVCGNDSDCPLYGWGRDT